MNHKNNVQTSIEEIEMIQKIMNEMIDFSVSMV